MYGWMDMKKQKDGWIDIKMDGWIGKKKIVGWMKKIDGWLDGQEKIE